MARPTGYSLTSYGDMISDAPRMDAYARALAATLRPGNIVLDIGAGTGIFSLLACRYGAGHVHAVEPNDAIEVARSLAAANGYADRITFHSTLSTEVALPTPADVIVSDLRGVLPLFQHHISSIVDARTRLLAPGGALIPRRDTLWVALVADEATQRRYAEPWLHNAYDLDLSAGYPLAVNSWRKVNARADQLVVPPLAWATLDYATVAGPDIAGQASWTAERNASAHGLLLWFDAELADGIGFSNAPGQPDLIYGQAYFPLRTPIVLEPGDVVSVQLRADLVGDMDDDTQTLTLADLIAFLRRYADRRRRRAVAAGVLAYVISTFLPDVYEARSVVLAAQTNPEFRQFGVGIATAAPST
jgi:type I protein arginine methyltransferase